MSQAKKESIMVPQETPFSQLISDTSSTPLSTIKTPLEPKARNGDTVPEQILLTEKRKDDYSYQKITFYTLLNVKDRRLQQLKLVGSQQALCLAETFYSAVVPVDAFCKLLVSSAEHLSTCPYLGTIKDMLLSLWLGLATMSSITIFQKTVNEFIPYYICDTALRDMQKSSGFDLKNVILIYTLNVLKERSDRVGLPWHESLNSILLYFIFIFKPSERSTVRKLLQFNAELAHILRATPAAST